MSYDELSRKEIDTGDILLFSGTGPISNGIKAGSLSKWSHVGVAIYSPELDVLLAYQSTTLSKIKDYTDGIHKQGVQVNLLSDVLNTYKGEVAVRNLDVHRTPEMLRVLSYFRREMKGRPYEQSKIELIKSVYDGPFGVNIEDLSSLFCSELVAELYQRWGLISEDIPSNEFVPANFAPESGLELLRGATLSDVVYLKR